MSNQARYVDWGRGVVVRKVIGSNMHQSQLTAGNVTKAKTQALPANAPPALAKALAAASAAVHAFDLAKARGNPHQISERRRDLEIARVTLEYEKKIALTLDEIAHARQFRYGV